MRKIREKTDLRNTQVSAVATANALGSCAMFPGMGFGKTAVGLTIAEEHFRSENPSPVLIVGSKKIIENSWPDDYKEWAHVQDIPLKIIKGNPTQRTRMITSPHGMYLLGQDVFPWLVDQYRRKPDLWPFKLVIFDDVNLKDHTAKRFKRLKKIRPHIDRCIPMTGTPTGNSGYLGLWSQIYAVDQGERLGKTFFWYRDRFFNSDYMGWEYELKLGAKEEIDRLIADVCIYDESEVEKDLPPVNVRDIKIKLPVKARQVYDEMLKEFIISLGNNNVEAPNSAVLSGKLKQIASGAVYTSEEYQGDKKPWVDVHDEKIKVLKNVIDRFNGESVLVAYNFAHSLEKLQREFPFACTIHEEDAVRRWNNKEIPILLMHPKSGGHGLNLQFGGRVVYWYDLEWSLEMYMQYNKRLHRPGQTEDVYIVRAVAEGTVDEIITKNLADNRATQRSLIAALKRSV